MNASTAAIRSACPLPSRSEKKITSPVRKIVIASVASEPSAWT